MRSTLSARMLEAMHAQSTGEVILTLVALSQDGWDDTLRLVANNEPITHLGHEYSPMAFEMSLPDEEDGTVPVLNWRADNTDRRLVEALRSVRGAVDARVVWILASDPDHIQIGPFDVEMTAANYDANEITGTLGIAPVLDLQFGHMTLNPATAPALF